MNRLAIFFGALMAVIGLSALADPSLLLQAIPVLLTHIGLYSAAVFRIIVGVVLILAANTGRLPLTLRILGALIVIGGVITPFVGVERARALVEWWSASGPILRIWAVGAVLLGGLIIYAATPRRKAVI